MPKEVFGSIGQYHVAIGWGAGGRVQLGTIGADGRSLNWQLYGDPASRSYIGERIIPILEEASGGPLALVLTPAERETLGGLVLNVLDTCPGAVTGPDPAAYMGVWTHLDRDEVNAVIKTMRRARDYTFGRDE